jgi:RimJ/RimL family protein N-acetyltransferase
MTSDALFLRRLDPDRDGRALHAIFGDEESCRYMTGPAFAGVEETIAALRKWSAGCEDTSWAVTDREGGAALGRVALIPRGRDVWEAACMIAPAARGRNLAARAPRPSKTSSIATARARRVFADIDPDNRACIRTFEALGFRYEGCLKGNWETHIGVRDSLIYALLHDEPRVWRKP